jgi:hypothetical protein
MPEHWYGWVGYAFGLLFVLSLFNNDSKERREIAELKNRVNDLEDRLAHLEQFTPDGKQRALLNQMAQEGVLVPDDDAE